MSGAATTTVRIAHSPEASMYNGRTSQKHSPSSLMGGLEDNRMKRGIIFGGIIIAASRDEAAALARRAAPEHLVCDDDRLANAVGAAGAIFVGSYTAQVAGDYAIGSNHVLPTARSARFSSGLGVLDFMKRTSILGCDPSSLSALAGAAVASGSASADGVVAGLQAASTQSAKQARAGAK